MLLPQTQNVLVEQVLAAYPQAFLTGSRAYGAADFDSDYDIVVPIQMYGVVGAFIKDRLPAPSEAVSQYLHSNVRLWDISGQVQGVINLFGLVQVEYRCWRVATAMMMQLPPIKDKLRRCAVFESLRAAVKMTMEPT